MTCVLDRAVRIARAVAATIAYVLVAVSLAASLVGTVPFAHAARAEPTWVEQRQIGLFHCRSEFSLEDFTELCEQLTQLDDDVAEVLGLEPSEKPIDLYLFDSKSSYQAYMNERFPEAPARRALFIKGRGASMVFAYRSKELPTDLRHEATHAVLHNAIDDVPLWLDEGIAEYFEVPAEDRVENNPHAANIRRNLWLPMFWGVTALETLEALKAPEEMGHKHYRDSWAWVHFMLHGPEVSQQLLADYLDDLAHGEHPRPLSHRLVEMMGHPETKLADHFRNKNR